LVSVEILKMKKIKRVFELEKYFIGNFKDFSVENYDITFIFRSGF
jgi:hypothetical protein